MKLFGHYVTRLFVLLAGVDALLLVGGLLSLERLGSLMGLPGPAVGMGPGQAAPAWAVAMAITTSLGLYNGDAARRFGVFAKRFLLAWQLVVAVGGAALLAVAAGAGRPSLMASVAPLAAAAALVMTASFAGHVLVVAVFGHPLMRRRIIVLGDGPCADAVVDFLTGPGRTHCHHLQTVSAQPPASRVSRVGNLLLKPSAEQALPLCALAESLRADEIVVAVDGGWAPPAAELLDCKLMGVAVVDAVSFWEREAGQIDPVRTDAGRLAFSDGFVCHRRHRLVKRAADVLVSTSFLVFMAPVILATALAIKLESRGPVFYRQERVGLNGCAFHVWKFRSMRTDAERDGVPRWANTTDDRVTRIGRFIRKVRIDEIPQIINVLAGEMSFIGPRPERPYFVEQLREQIPHYDLRHRVRPGITGWAQVNYPYGASVDDARFKLSYDLYYLKKNDVLLDLAILLQTVRVILFAHGAR